MRPLKRQAEAANRHQETAHLVRALTLFLSGEEIQRLDMLIKESADQKERLDSAIRQAEREISSREPEAALLDSRAQSLSLSTERDALAAARLETTLESLRRIAQVAHERHRSALSRQEDVDARRRDLEAELRGIEIEHGEVSRAEGSARQLTEQLEASLRLFEAQERSLADQAGLSAEGALAVAQGEHRSLVAADDRDQRELEAVEKRLLVLSDQRGNQDRISEQLVIEIRNLDAQVSQASSAYEAAASRSRQDQAGWESAQIDEQEARIQSASALARLEAIRHVITDREAGGRMVTEAPGALGPLLDLLRVPREWRLATSVALGPFAAAIAFESAESMKKAVEHLKSQAAGGVAIVGVDGSNPARADEETGLPALLDIIGVTKGDDQFTLAWSLLGDVVVAEGWAAAWSVVERHRGIRVVTPEGDLITAAGIRLADASSDTLEEAESRHRAAERELARATSRVTTVHRGFEASRVAERTALEALEAVEIRLAGATESLGRSRRQSAELGGEGDRLRVRQSLLQGSIAERQSAIAQLAESMAILEGEEGRRQALLAELDERRRLLAKEQEQTRESWKEAALRASTALERKSMLEARKSVIAEELSEARPARTVSADTLTRLAKVETLARRAIEIVALKVAALRDRLGVERDEERAVDLSLREQRNRLNQLQSSIDDSRQALAEVMISATEARVRREAVIEALAREIDARPEEAMAATRPTVDSDDLEELLAIKSAELRRMGPVNPLAAEEYRELFERHEFLSGQLEDLERSRVELRKVMKALDEEIESRFISAFEEVAANYEQYFTVLFPGGQGRMRLTDPDSPLTSGVEIEAQPHGKKVNKLSLLSGGERSLAALAFLFAVFRARPSPFYILDEVEAALDDANLRRFLRLLDAFRGESQLILITHQQQTMEAADVLYGVTMEPGGSSQVITRDFVLA
jgi:chromosome segregation protein